MKLVRGIAMAAALSFAGTAASAVTFDFAGDDSTDLGASIVFGGGSNWTNPAVPGISLTVTAGSTLAGTPVVSRKGGGLAVSRNPSSNLDSRNLNPGESLTFTFSPAQTVLGSLLYEDGGSDDTYSLFKGDDLLGTFVVSGTSRLRRINLFDTFTKANLTGSSFTLRYDGGGTEPSDLKARIQSISIVPLPPAILGVISAFGLAFGVRRATTKRAA